MTRPPSGAPQRTGPDAAHPARARLALLTTASVAVALAAADTYIVVLALTDMMTSVGVGIESLQRATPIISGFLLGYIAVLPLIGRLSDLLDRQRVLLACLVVFALGSVVTALAVDMTVLVSGRVLQGIGGGGLVPATLALVADMWPVSERGTPLGVVGAVQELGAVLGPVLGAVILAWSGWRAIFWLNAAAAVVLWVVLRIVGRRRTAGNRPGQGGSPPHTLGAQWPAVAGAVLGGIGVLVLLLALWAPERLATHVTYGVPFVPITGESRLATPVAAVAGALLVAALAVSAPRWWPVLRQADLFGAALLALALASLVLTFSTSEPEREVVGPLGWSLLPVGVLALAVLWWWHRTAANPLVPRGTMHARGVRALAVSLLVGASLVAVIMDVPLLARLREDVDAAGGALVLVRFLLAVPVGAVLGGWLIRRVGDGVVAGAGLLLAAAGMFAMSRWTLAAMAPEQAVATTVVLAAVGLGVGLALAPVNNAAIADSPPSAHGVASSLVVVARMVGMVVGLALLTAVGLHRYFEAARGIDPFDSDALLSAGVVQVQTVFLGGALAALLAGLLAFTLGRGPATLPR